MKVMLLTGITPSCIINPVIQLLVPLLGNVVSLTQVSMLYTPKYYVTLYHLKRCSEINCLSYTVAFLGQFGRRYCVLLCCRILRLFHHTIQYVRMYAFACA